MTFSVAPVWYIPISNQSANKSAVNLECISAETKDLLSCMQIYYCPVIIYNTLLHYESIYLNSTNTDFIDWIIASSYQGFIYA